ncbi:hypothetical protein GE21DRAFT_1353721 [Neurospora crassa]|nr:hypothetical protein GE21DRAFT_1353721 [Neurospora crassa]
MGQPGKSYLYVLSRCQGAGSSRNKLHLQLSHMTPVLSLDPTWVVLGYHRNKEISFKIKRAKKVQARMKSWEITKLGGRRAARYGRPLKDQSESRLKSGRLRRNGRFWTSSITPDYGKGLKTRFASRQISEGGAGAARRDCPFRMGTPRRSDARRGSFRVTSDNDTGTGRYRVVLGATC